MKTKPCFTILTAIMTALVLSSPSNTAARELDERILDFHSTINVRKDSSLLVTEVIKVRSTGSEIRHGIYRDFPVVYKTNTGFIRRVGFTVLGVMRNEEPENYTLENQGNNVRVKIGRADTDLDTGEHVFILTYRTDSQLGYFGSFTELYWNVTGNEWAFPIDRATADVTLPLPQNVEILKIDGYTGPAGSRDKYFLSRLVRSNKVFFQTTAPLGLNEGLTIVVQWPDGFVEKPSMEETRSRFIRDNHSILIALAGIMAVFLYYLAVWIGVGRDPEKGTIIPQYTPPDNLSPAAMRYITQMGYDKEVFASSLLSLAVKGYITIEDEDGDYTLKKTGKGTDPAPEEKKIMEKLFKKGKDSIILENKNHTAIAAAVKSLKDSLSLSYEKNYFMKNLKYFIPGLVLSCVIMLVSLFIDFTTTPENFILIWLFFWTIGVFFLMSRVVLAWKEALRARSFRPVHIFGALFITAFSIPFLGAEFLVLGFYITMASWLMPVSVLAMALVNFVFYHLLKAPTRVGRQVLDKIEGFRMYMAVTEKDRLNTLARPDKSLKTFERFLPYALALGIANQWADYFSDVIQTADSSSGDNTWHPAWYSGTSWDSAGSLQFISNMGNSLGSAVSSSSSPPGSSSGGGSGGSSGGGGGGGGGGGW